MTHRPPVDLAAIRARIGRPLHFDSITARAEIPWLRETVARLADEVELLRSCGPASVGEPPFRDGEWKITNRRLTK